MTNGVYSLLFGLNVTMSSHYAFIFCNTWHKLSVDVKISISSAKCAKLSLRRTVRFSRC